MDSISGTASKTLTPWPLKTRMPAAVNETIYLRYDDGATSAVTFPTGQESSFGSMGWDGKADKRGGVFQADGAGREDKDWQYSRYGVQSSLSSARRADWPLRQNG